MQKFLPYPDIISWSIWKSYSRLIFQNFLGRVMYIYAFCPTMYVDTALYKSRVHTPFVPQCIQTQLCIKVKYVDFLTGDFASAMVYLARYYVVYYTGVIDPLPKTSTSPWGEKNSEQKLNFLICDECKVKTLQLIRSDVLYLFSINFK